MKGIMLVISLLFSVYSYSQNGTYRCNIQRFEDENNPENSKEHSNSMIVIIDINEYTGGAITISWPSENFTYKWDILKKLDVKVDTEKKTVYTYYEARFNVANGQATISSIAYIIQDMNDNSLHIAVNNPSAETTNWYHNLIKITY